MSLGFNAANNATGLIHKTGIFNNAKFGGYVASGTKYSTRLCLNNNICKIINAYSGETVTQDNWLYDLDGTYGIIGMGPQSPFWSGFTDPDTLTSNYSISLGRITAQGLIPKSNITFGGVSIEDYTGATYAQVASERNYSYALNNFEFGIVYQTNGKDSSEYFQALQTQYPVVFTLNFQGLGLPANVWESVTALIGTVSHGQAVCDKSPDGTCVLPGSCS